MCGGGFQGHPWRCSCVLVHGDWHPWIGGSVADVCGIGVIDAGLLGGGVHDVMQAL